MNDKWKPDKKVAGGALAIGVPGGVIVAWALGQFGLVVPPEVAAAIGSFVSAIAAYFLPN